MSGYLLDTNSVIYFFNGEEKIGDFLEEIQVASIDDEIIGQTIKYRKNNKLKVPDAIICATAKVMELTLVTADKSITKKLKRIKLISPI